jgi:hypothetical protein
MTREQHRRMAEVLLENAWKRSAADDTVFIHTPERRTEIIAKAHVHALLAPIPGDAE